MDHLKKVCPDKDLIEAVTESLSWTYEPLDLGNYNYEVL
jgi:hypothetical protein